MAFTCNISTSLPYHTTFCEYYCYRFCKIVPLLLFFFFGGGEVTRPNPILESPNDTEVTSLTAIVYIVDSLTNDVKSSILFPYGLFPPKYSILPVYAVAY